MPTETKATSELTFQDFKDEILNDYKTAITSRECSLLGRREVLTGKAKFGIFGDGKEVPQLAWAKVFKNGDFRSGYYRDQTLMMSIGKLSIQEFFAGLYGHTSIEADPMSADVKWVDILEPIVLMKMVIGKTSQSKKTQVQTSLLLLVKCQDF